jgi:L-malate glycosyltransferase
MKLLFYNHTATVSGAERVLLLILSQLDAREFPSVVLCPPGHLQQLVEAENVPCLTAAPLEARFTWRPDYLLRYLLSFVRAIRSVRAQIQTVAPDLIHANSIRAGLVMTAATLGLRVPVIWHLHDLLPHHPISTAIRWCVLASTRVRLLAVSQATAERFQGLLLRMFPQRVPSQVLLNCADTEKFQPDAETRQATRAALKLSADQFVIGIIGQITERKGQLGLLRAFAQVREEMPNAVLLVVGEPLFTAADQQYFQRLQQIAAELGLDSQVRFLGARCDVPAVLRALDLLVVNSLAEPCGLVVLEGMASALPVIATAVGGNPEMIQHEQNGWLVPAQDERALAAAIIKLGQMPLLRKQLGAKARLRVFERFTIPTYLAALQKFYYSCGNSEVQRQAQWTELPSPSTALAPNDLDA